MKKERFHQYGERLDSARKYIQGDKNLSPRNKELILSFEKQLLVEGLSLPRIIKYFYVLRTISTVTQKDFDKLTKDDLVNYVAHLNSEKYSEWTKVGYKVVLKKFMKWVKGFNGEGYPEEVSWIKALVPKHHMKLPNEGDLLNEEDVKSMIDSAGTFRDKALIAVLWESGARVGEVGTIQIKDVVFDKYGAQVNVEGKTGSRKIRLISSVPNLSQWLCVHPDKNDRNAFVWVTIGKRDKKQLVKYQLIARILKETAVKAGVQKRVNPHSFRHSRATFLANHLTEFQMNQYFGWVQGSDMSSTYVHLSGKNTEDALLKLNGVFVEEEKKKSDLQPKKCVRCSTFNDCSNQFCRKCGGVLDLKAALDLEEEQKKDEKRLKMSDEYLNQLFEDPEILSIMMRKIQELRMQKEAVQGY